MPSDQQTTARWRWRVAMWLLYRGLRVAPDGSAAIALEDMLRDWGMKWERF